MTELALKVFLSHSYKASLVNLYFYKLFSQRAQLTFEVDVPKTTMNVTRLERMIRDADAFIGIYPFDTDDETAAPSRKELLEASRYFRFELDLAFRSRKPALVFYDRQYGDVFRGATGTTMLRFDSREVTSKGSSPSAIRFGRAFERFCETIDAAKQLSLLLDRSEASGVGILLPPDSNGRGYGDAEREAIRNTLDQYGYADLRSIPWPPRLDLSCAALLRDIDWVIADLGEPIAASFVGTLHGSFVPTMRLLRISSDQPMQFPELEDVLYHEVDVGYRKDILRWRDVESLQAGLAERLASLREQGRWISTADEADGYFREASLRKEPVFLSYAQADQDLASRLRIALQRSFKDVFDYRDGQSMEPGPSWLEQVSKRIANSAIGIALLSDSYFDSSYCRKEAELLEDAALANQLRFITIKLDKDQRLQKMPNWLGQNQYLRWWEYATEDHLVEKIRQTLST